jgi:hypothetical protein
MHDTQTHLTNIMNSPSQGVYLGINKKAAKYIHLVKSMTLVWIYIGFCGVVFITPFITELNIYYATKLRHMRN